MEGRTQSFGWEMRMSEFHDTVRRHVTGVEAQDRDRITGVNPLRARGAALGGAGSRIEQFYQGFDSAHSPEATDEPG